MSKPRRVGRRMIRQRNGNMRNSLRMLCSALQGWANTDDCSFDIIREPGRYSWVFAGEPFVGPPSTYIAMTVHPQKVEVTHD